MLSEWLHYQGKAGFLIEFFKMVAISRNTGKCELDRFSLRQSHIILYSNQWVNQHILLHTSNPTLSPTHYYYNTDDDHIKV